MAKDRIFSSRMDEHVIDRINMLARNLGLSKKAVIEKAILSFAGKQESGADEGVFARTCGAWKHEGSPAEEVDLIRRSFRDSMERKHK